MRGAWGGGADTPVVVLSLNRKVQHAFLQAIFSTEPVQENRLITPCNDERRAKTCIISTLTDCDDL